MFYITTLKINTLLRGLLLLLGVFASSKNLFATSSQAFKLEQETQILAKQKIAGIVSKYCGDSCELMNVEVFIDEIAAEPEDVGFESVVGDNVAKLSVARILIDMQVDDRVTTADRDRLGKLISNALRNLSPAAQVRWSTVAFPQIGVSAEVEDRLKSLLHQKIQTTAQSVIDAYCSKECVLTNVVVDGRIISPDEARGVNERELVRDRGGRGILRLDNVDIDLSLDEKMIEGNRTKVYNLIKAKTKYAFPVNINVSVVDFPDLPVSSGRAGRLSESESDPWGLDRLRQTLQIFRDLASTKEIITNTQSASTLSTKDSMERSESRDSRELSSSKERLSATEQKALTETSKASEVSNSASKSEGSQTYEYAIYVGAFLLLAGIIVALIMRMSSASKDARIMMETASHAQQSGKSPYGQMLNGGGHQETSQDWSAQGQPMSQGNLGPGATAMHVGPERMSIRFKIESLREDILSIFTNNPKIAKDVFTRMLQEDGVETTSRYVHVFGPLIVFELMNDPNLQRDLYDLSEYFHKATFVFSDLQTLELLVVLKTKITASEIKLMTRRRTEQFDFLQILDAQQVFLLINDERPQVQSIVLTQLDHQRRRAVFDMYAGQAKVGLMRELCRADAIPKEYLANVAKALNKKVHSRSEFDVEQLRSNDIIFDLLEKSTLQDQRALMSDLVKSNPDAARAIKLKLVTVEMMPYLKDGHLLEIFMGLEREDLLAFLVGTPEHIRELLLSKAPSELAASWAEDLEQVTGVEEATYRLAELKIINRLRTLANNGAIRLLDINDRIFAEEHLAAIRQSREQVDVAISKNSMAA
ncbi:MAG: hypothetical protein NTV34_10780 [Proteobacteria bacterium]|nr:hypothetical protein [Pseudomonadota bacterium]